MAPHFHRMRPQVEPPVESPDDLLRSLTLELAQKRARRAATEGQRMALIAGGLLLILAGASAALSFAFTQLTELAQREHPPKAAAAAGALPE